ncbi:MAG: hypothetical protein ACI4P1_04165, partial [Erysipelotrichaceae bacterium]
MSRKLGTCQFVHSYDDIYKGFISEKTEYDIQGTCYMDSRNSLDDGDLIIYGCYSKIGFKDYKDY